MGYEKFSFYTFLTHSKLPNHSRPVTRPAIFRGQIFFKKAGFLKTGLVQGRLATLLIFLLCFRAQNKTVESVDMTV
jgi:hypothetical protein